MANEIYHRSNWGESKPEGFGDMYFDSSATNKLYNRSTYYENSDATDKILGDIPNKASIVLTPTGYSEDSINTAIPPYQVLPTNIVTNGTFDTDSDWTKGTGWTIGNGVASNDGSASYLTSTASFRWQIGKKYRVSLEVTAYSSGQISLPFDATGANLNYENSIGVKSTIIVAGATNPIYIYSNSFNGSIDNVSVQEIQEADFTFARNSSATRVNQAGLIEDVNSSTNLVSNPDFSNGSNNWSLGTGWTVSNNTAIHTGSTGNISTNASLTQGKRYVVEFEILSIADGVCNIYDTGSATTYSSFSSVGVKTATITKDSSSSLAIRSNSSNAVIDNVSVIQLDEATDIPRLDYTTGQGAFLLEPQSTNLIKYSEDFSQWNASSGASVVTNNAISPDGTQNASTFTFDGTTNGRVELLTDGVTSSEDVTFSVYLKTLSGTEQVYIGHSVFGLKTVTVDDQWKRYTSTATASAGFAYPRVRIDSATSVLVWGYQLEQQSFATSYIPTVGSTVTRSAETSVGSGNSDLFNDSEGVLYGEISALADDGTYRAFAICDDSSANRIYLGFGNGSNQLRLEMTASSSAQVILTHNVSDTKEFQKLAVRYKTNDVSFYVNGLEVGTDTNATIPTGLDTLKFTSGSTGSILYARTKNMSVFKEELTALELEKLTSWRDFRDLAESQQYTLVTIKSDAIVVSAYGTTSGGGGVSGGGSGGAGGY